MLTDNLIAVYTSMRILREMKKTLGLEAMHEYLDLYVKTIDQDCPAAAKAVDAALKIMNVNKMYEQMKGSANGK